MRLTSRRKGGSEYFFSSRWYCCYSDCPDGLWWCPYSHQQRGYSQVCSGRPWNKHDTKLSTLIYTGIRGQFNFDDSNAKRLTLSCYSFKNMTDAVRIAISSCQSRNLPSFDRNGTLSPLSTSKVHSRAQKLPGHTSESRNSAVLSTLLAQQGYTAIWARPTTVPRRWVLLDLPRPLLMRAQNTTSSRPPSHRYAARVHLTEHHQLTHTA